MLFLTTMRFTGNGFELEYEDAGSGVPLLLIHGFPLDRSLWRFQIDGLRDVARIIAPDLRGFGQSSDAPGSMSMDDYAEDLVSLLDSLSIERAVICGLSMGGYVALSLLERHPGRVRGLVLANTRAGADSEEARQSRFAAAEKALGGGVPELADAMLPKLLVRATLNGRPGLVEKVRDMMAEQRATGVAAALRGMADRPDRASLLPAIDVPILVITGAGDTLIPTSESEAMAGVAGGSKLVIIPGAGHLSSLETPDAFNAALREFLGPMGSSETVLN